MAILRPRRLCLLSSISLNHGVSGFTSYTHQNLRPTIILGVKVKALPMVPSEDDVDPPVPGQMKLSEIKSELDLRAVPYSDCFDRESLEIRLNEARSSGKADPSILDQFNKANEEAAKEGKSLEIEEGVLESALGGDGTLPGGMPPEMLQDMMSDPELIAMLRNPKMQEVMKLVMEGGQDAFEEATKGDEEMIELVKKLNAIMGRLNNNQ